MKNLKSSITFITLSILITFNYSCKKEETNPSVKIITVTVKNEGTFNYTGGLTYAVVDSMAYDLKIETEPTDANVYYSINDGEIQYKNTEYITIDSNDKYISFFSTSEGVCMEGNNRLDFGFGIDSLESEITIFPNPFGSIVSFRFESNIRGVLHFKVSDVRGVEQYSNDYFMYEKTIIDSVDLSTSPLGIYFFIFDYGNTRNVARGSKNG